MSEMNALPQTSRQISTQQPTLHCQLLGPPIVSWNNLPLDIPRRMVRALLYRIASSYLPVSRSLLQLLFWPEEPELTARRNLSHLLTHLRRCLPQPEWLVTSAEAVWLDSVHLWSDIALLKQYMFGPAPDLPLAYLLVDQYRGPFLDGFFLPGCPEYEQWCLVERNILEEQYLKILSQLVGHFSSDGDISLAIKYAQLYLESEPLSEPMHQQLMKLYAASGERHLALQQYDRCSRLLASNLNVEPLPETTLVYQAVLQGKLRITKPIQQVLETHKFDSEPLWIGRARELTVLDSSFFKLQEERSQIILISGEAGVGKSRLLREFASRIQYEGYLLYACGHAGEQTVPFQPLREILLSIFNCRDPDQLAFPGDVSSEFSLPDYINPLWLCGISNLLPELHRFFPETSSPTWLDLEDRRAYLFDAICRIIFSCADYHGKLVLFLDDLPWMDAATKVWITHFGRLLAQHNHPILIVATYNRDQEDEINELRQALLKTKLVSEIGLSRFTESDVQKLLYHLIGRQADDSKLVHKFYKATGGNPFYLIETVRKLIEDGWFEDTRRKSTPLNLPQSVCEAVQARLKRLSPVTWQILEAAAVLGGSIDVDLLRLTAGRSHAELMTAVNELVNKMILVETQSGFCFIHEIIAQHVADNLGRTRKRLLHRRAGRAYLHLRPDAYTTLAYHFESCGDLHKALEFHTLAFQQAQEVYAWRVAKFHQSKITRLSTQITEKSCRGRGWNKFAE